MKSKRGFLEISFGTLFAIIVGIFILFLAIFIVVKLMETEDVTQSAKVGEEIGILLNPLETSFETGKVTSFSIPIESRIYTLCEDEGIFGRQQINLTQKRFGEWRRTDLIVGFSNKYIFSEKAEGKRFNIFSKPFSFPFKVSDLVYLSSSSQEYCFKNAPSHIKNEIRDLGQENFILDKCNKESITICFESRNCNVSVDYMRNVVEKKGKSMYFEGDALMYAAIFSSSEDYECQLRRLIKRVKQLAQLYNDKSKFVSLKECDSNLESNLLQLINLANNFEDSSDLVQIKRIVNIIKEKNDANWKCKLW
jgi:hypothetical protein